MKKLNLNENGRPSGSDYFNKGENSVKDESGTLNYQSGSNSCKNDI